MLYSRAVLVALFLAVPAGLILREPLSATISTLVGAIFFTLYVLFAFKKKHIRSAKIVAFTENAGISVKSTTEVKIDVDEIYVALSGDQVALTNIRVSSDSES
jgi:hypothetical protein